MPFVFMIESAGSVVDFLLKPAEVSSLSCLDGGSWRAGIADMKEPDIPSPPSSDKEQDRGECPRHMA